VSKNTSNKSKPVGRQKVTVSYNAANEQLILAAMMHDRIVLRDLSSSLDPETFIGGRHKILFSILRDISTRHLSFDLEILEQIGGRKEYGGRRYVEDLLSAYTDVPKNLEYHVDRLRTDSIKFTLRVGRLQDLMDLSENPHATLDEISDALRDVQGSLSGRLQTGIKRGYDLYTHYISDVRARRKESNFVPTGYDYLDENLTEGLARKKISFWTARPSMGKSTLAWNIADRVTSIYKIPTLFLSLEMGEVSTVDGIIASRTEISLDKIIKYTHQMTAAELQAVNDAAYQFANNDLLTFYTKSVKFEELPRIIDEGGYGIVIFDLWEKLVPQKKQDVIAEYLDRTRILVNDCDVHAMCLHQTKRGVEQRSDKRPTLEDLKNSGAYEENADLVVALYREKYYSPDMDRDILEMGILKQRRGSRLGWYFFEFLGHIGKVGDAVRDWEGQDDYE
jgi:replicative DNA helicase